MTDEMPHSIVTGRRVAIGLLVAAMVITVLGALWLVAEIVTAPAVV